MDNIKNIKKQWINSLVFLDNCIINSIIVVILLLYSTTIFENINIFIGNLYKFSIVKLVIILLIIYVSPKDTTIAILLAISYIISLQYSLRENFISDTYSSKNNSATTVISQLSEAPQYSSKIESFQGLPIQNESSSFINNSIISKISIDPAGSPPYSSKIESFQGFPFQNDNTIEPVEHIKDKKKIPANCLNNYSPKNENISDVCEPVSILDNSLNAQGLNSPEGYGSMDSGSPL
jgi:hypothetical protein